MASRQLTAKAFTALTGLPCTDAHVRERSLALVVGAGPKELTAVGPTTDSGQTLVFDAAGSEVGAARSPQTVSVSPKLFRMITHAAADPDNILTGLDQVFSRIPDVGNKVVCITDTTGSQHCFDSNRKPIVYTSTRQVRSVGRPRSGRAARSPEPVRAPDEVRDQRFAICRACELFDPKKQRCQKCSCGGQGQYHLAAGRCPRDLWPAFDLLAHLKQTRAAAVDKEPDQA